MRARVAAAVALPLVFVSCSWTRFNNLQEDTPVLLLSKPDTAGNGFGSGLASVTREQVRLLVTASPGARSGAEYSLGNGQEPNRDAVDTGDCNDATCSFANSVAGLESVMAGGVERSTCFAEGLTAPSTLYVRCMASGDLPPLLQAWQFPTGLSMDPKLQHLALAADRGPLPSLVAGFTEVAPARGEAWFYAGGTGDTPTTLTPAGVGSSFGSAVAVLGAARFGVGEPDAKHLFLFDGATEVGCLTGAQDGFGRTLTTGDVDGDGVDDLVVASKKDVQVLSGSALGSFGPADPAACEAIPDAMVIATLNCHFTADVDGCGGGDFGASLAVANFDRGKGDTDGEVVVGAPGMSVRGESSAGAILVFDVEPGRLDKLLEAKYISSAESGDRLGAAVAVVHQADRDIVVGGAPGGGKAAVFYCSKLLPSGQRGARCQ